jgi:hypothetical protein
MLADAMSTVACRRNESIVHMRISDISGRSKLSLLEEIIYRREVIYLQYRAL